MWPSARSSARYAGSNAAASRASNAHSASRWTGGTGVRKPTALGGSAAVAEACHAVLAPRAALVEAALVAGLETSDELHGMRIADLICTRPNARALLFAAFDGPAENVQINAAFGIAKLGAKVAGPDGRRRLQSGLPGPPTRRRYAIIKALAMLGPDQPTR